MANTVSIINYANTFGEWMVATQNLSKENNDLAINNYTKNSGTLYLSEPTLALQSNGSAIFTKQFSVQGSGSYANVQNNLAIGGQLFLTNASSTIVSSGPASFNGTITAQSSGTGLSVSNNATVGGNVAITKGLTVNGNTNLNGTTVTSTANTVIANTLHVSSQANFNNNVVVGGNFNVLGTLSPSSLNVAGDALVNNNLLVANNIVSPLAVLSNNLYANTTVFTGSLQANTKVNTATISVAGTTYTNNVTANSTITSPNVIVTTKFDANSATVSYFNNIYAGGQLSVAGNFVINGTTVYNSNTFTINSGSSIGQFSVFSVNRGSSGSNAAIRWNETEDYFDINDVSTGTYYRILSDQYINDTVTSTNTKLLASANVANTLNNSINVRVGVDVSQNTNITNVGAYANAAFNKANSVVQTGFTTITANGSSITPSSNADTLTVTAASANGISITNPSSKTIDFGLRPSGATSGVYGGTTNIPVVTVDTFGRVTNIANTTVSTTINLSANSGTGSVAGGGTLNIVGNTGISTFTTGSNYYINNTGVTYLNTAAASRLLVSSGTGNTTIDLATIGGLSAGSYVYPSLQVDSYGRITSISSQTPVTSLNGSTGSITLTHVNNANNITGGAANKIPYQTSASNTSFIDAPSTSNTLLLWNGTSFAWSSNTTNVIDDNSTNSTQYLTTIRSSSGYIRDVYTSTSKLYFNPSSGSLNATSFNGLSDATRKTNISKINNATETLEKIDGVEFNWIDNGDKSSGVIAQELEKTLPFLVHTNENGVKSVNYDGLIGYLIESNKELSARIKLLEMK